MVMVGSLTMSDPVLLINFFKESFRKKQMLKQLSRLEKTRNIVILIFVIMMAVSLVIFYAPGRNSSPVTVASQSQEVLATVGSEVVTVGEIATQKENMERQFGAQAMSFMNSKRMLDGAIQSRITSLEAARLGLAATDEEVAANIRKQLKDEKGNTIELDKYKQIVTENYGGVEKFEKAQRDQIASEKLQAFLTSGVNVSEAEVLENYKKQNTAFDLVYVPVTSTLISGKVQPSDEELRTYFENNKKTYFITSPQKKIRYLFINQSKVGEKLEISEADLKAEYDQIPADKKQQGVQVQQIVIRIAKPELEATAKEKADKLVAEARKEGGVISAEKFAEMAKGSSEDPKTAQNGGKIAGLVKANPNNPTDPLQQTLNMSVGTVTDPIKFGSNFYIFRRGEAVPKTFEDAKQEILVSLRNRRAYKIAAELAQKAATRLQEVKEVKAVANELAAEANMKPEDMVRETGFIKPGDDVKDIGNSPQFEQGIASLENPNDVGERTPIKDGFAIPMLVEKKEPRDAEFDEVKDQVLAAVKLEKAKTQVEQVAKEIAANANSPEALKSAAEKAGLKASESKDYRLGSPLGEGGVTLSGTDLEAAISKLKAGEVTKEPIKSGDNYVVVAATKRTEANLDEFAKQRDQLTESALSMKKSQIFSDYLAEVRQRMEKEGRIKINKDALAKLDAKSDTDE
jgi:peptidyl-prolyl cis-trans isomerase D